MRRILTVLLLFACVSCVNPHAPAELATFQAIAPEYSAYVEADPALTTEQKQLRLDTVETWRRRVEAQK